MAVDTKINDVMSCQIHLARGDESARLAMALDGLFERLFSQPSGYFSVPGSPMTLVLKWKSPLGSARKNVSPSSIAVRTRVVVAVHQTRQEQQHGSP
jgi:hypothetical protein